MAKFLTSEAGFDPTPTILFLPAHGGRGGERRQNLNRREPGAGHEDVFIRGVVVGHVSDVRAEEYVTPAGGERAQLLHGVADDELPDVLRKRRFSDALLCGSGEVDAQLTVAAQARTTTTRHVRRV
ncbi:MAG: hypothetical protein ACT4O5_08275 [Gammaproteobacteria bacterium]